jgi:short-subunit dehydrogenase
VNALVALTREFLPDVQAGAGVIVNIASTAAYQPCPQMAVYGATKAFVLSFTEALSYETRGTGVTVLAVSPGPTSTEFFDVVGTKDAAVGRFETAAQVVTRTMRELDRSRPRPSFVSGPMNTLSAAMASLAPRRFTLAVSGRVLK